jgi:hypothetical protein
MTLAFLIFVGASAVNAHPVSQIFRPISFICAASTHGTVYKVEENILGQQRSYKVTYMGGDAALFVVSETRSWHSVKRIALIDLRAEFRPAARRMAREISFQMRLDADRFCSPVTSVRTTARDELLANHEFNRSHPRYRQL